MHLQTKEDNDSDNFEVKDASHLGDRYSLHLIVYIFLRILRIFFSYTSNLLSCDTHDNNLQYFRRFCFLFFVIIYDRESQSISYR